MIKGIVQMSIMYMFFFSSSFCKSRQQIGISLGRSILMLEPHRFQSASASRGSRGPCHKSLDIPGKVIIIIIVPFSLCRRRILRSNLTRTSRYHSITINLTLINHHHFNLIPSISLGQFNIGSLQFN